MADLTEYEERAVLAHFPQKMSKTFVDYVTDEVFLWSRYIFTRRVGKVQFGYCTHCRKECPTDGLKQGTKTECAKCKSACVVKASGRGRKSMVDEAYFVYYDKSVVNPEAIVARGVYAVRDYRGDYYKVETLFETKALYLFEPGNSVMLHRPYLYYSSLYGNGFGCASGYEKTASTFSEIDGSMNNKRTFCSYASIRAAVKDTPFQYSMWEDYRAKGPYRDDDMVKFFDLAAKYPCIEYLTKFGMHNLVEAKLYGRKTYGVINWRAKNPLKVLRLSKQELKEIRAQSIVVDPLFLKIHQLSKKDGSNLPIREIAYAEREYGSYSLEDLQQALKRTTLKKIVSYLDKEYAKQTRSDSKRQLLSTWNDYIADCITLGFDLSQDVVKFPPHLYQAHQNTIKQIKVKEDKALRAKIAARNKALQKLRFEALGFILRPAIDSKELIDEGQALQHCVGTYAARYANGDTDLFVLRKVEEPDKPYYTMEIRNGSIAQCRGLKNCDPTKEVQAFIEAFKAERLATKSNKNKTKIAVAV